MAYRGDEARNRGGNGKKCNSTLLQCNAGCKNVAHNGLEEKLQEINFIR